MCHITDRLSERKILISEDTLKFYASKCSTDSALIIVKLSDDVRDGFVGHESNGSLVILIVRNHNPVTVMFRRTNQPLTESALQVNEVWDVSKSINCQVNQ